MHMETRYEKVVANLDACLLMLWQIRKRLLKKKGDPFPLELEREVIVMGGA